jgi:hypothetical protein
MIASETCQSEIGQVRQAAMLLRDDVVDLMKSRRKSLWKLAVLAVVACPTPDRHLQGMPHSRGSTSSTAFLDNSTRLGVQNIKQTSKLLKGVDLQLLRRGESAGLGLDGQLPHPIMVARGETDFQQGPGSRRSEILVELDDPIPNPRSVVADFSMIFHIGNCSLANPEPQQIRSFLDLADDGRMVILASTVKE